MTHKKQTRKNKFVDKSWSKPPQKDEKKSEACSTSEMDLEAAIALNPELSDRLSRGSQLLQQMPPRNMPKPSKKTHGGFLRRTHTVSRQRRGKFSPRACFSFSRQSSDLSGFTSSVLSRTGTSKPIEEVATNDLSSDSAYAPSSRKQESEYPFTVSSLENHLGSESEGCGMTWLSSHERRKRGSKEHNLSVGEKYKPKSFDEIVGQHIVVMSLANTILKQKIVSLYLFHGPRGTGKSATARVFAAALNCLSEDSCKKPCWRCKSCSSFQADESPYIRKICPSNVEEVNKPDFRLDKLSRTEYNVCIVEDCHELNPEVLGRFLLECTQNSISNIVVILTTFDPEAIPKAILSRCQKYRFQKIKDVDMLDRLKNLAILEDIDIEDDALHMIASRAEGSLAQAEKSLEQLSLLSIKITVATVRQMTGVIPSQKLSELLFFALAADTEKTVKLAREILDSGSTPLALVSQLASLITDILAGECSYTDVKHIQNFASRQKTSWEVIVSKLGQALKILVESERQLRSSNTCSSSLTAALLKLGQDDLSETNSNPVLETINLPTFASIPKDWNETDRSDVKEISQRDNHQCNLKLSQPTGARDTAFPDPLNSEMATGSSTQNVQRSMCVRNSQKLTDPLSSEQKHLSSCRIEEIWQHVLRSSHSTTLEDLLQGQGKLVSLLVRQAKAIANVELRDGRQPLCNIEGLQQTIAQALQEVLGCPVDVKMTVAAPEPPKKDDNRNKKKDQVTFCGAIWCCCTCPFKCVFLGFKGLASWTKRLYRLRLKCQLCEGMSCMCLPRITRPTCRNSCNFC